MSRRIFIWVGHPRSGSLCSALADAYEDAARAGGAEVQRIDLPDMAFDSDQFSGYAESMPPLEPDLLRWQAAVTWADHLLIVHPYWWGGMPARAKSVFDRALTPGFAFRYKGKGIAWEKLLAGRTADVMITSDTPPWYDTLIYRKPARRVIVNQVLGFCGIRTRRCLQVGTVKTASPENITEWIDSAASMGREAGRSSQRRLSIRHEHRPRKRRHAGRVHADRRLHRHAGKGVRSKPEAKASPEEVEVDTQFEI